MCMARAPFSGGGRDPRAPRLARLVCELPDRQLAWGDRRDSNPLLEFHRLPCKPLHDGHHEGQTAGIEPATSESMSITVQNGPGSGEGAWTDLSARYRTAPRLPARARRRGIEPRYPGLVPGLVNTDGDVERGRSEEHTATSRMPSSA